MEFVEFIRRPFTVQALEITMDNISEVSELIGKHFIKDDVHYIALDRRVVPNVHRAYLGWWLTRFGDYYRCYSPKIFKAQFIKSSDLRALYLSEVPLETLPQGTYIHDIELEAG